MVLKRLQAYFKTMPIDEKMVSCIGKVPFYAEFIRFQIVTIESQSFATWVSNLYQSFLPKLSLFNKEWSAVLPIQFLWKNSNRSFVLGSVLGSQDSKGRHYPLGIARWSLSPFSVSFYEALASFDLNQFQHHATFERALHGLGFLEGGAAPSLLMKGLQAEQSSFYQLIGIFKSWVLRFNSMRQYQGIEIPLSNNISCRARLSLIQFWIQLTERLIFTVKWQQVYWNTERLLISFIPLSEDALVSWALEKKTGQWISLSDKIAVDLSVQRALQSQLREPVHNLDELLERLGER